MGTDDGRVRSNDQIANDATVSAAGVSRVESSDPAAGNDVSLPRGTQVGEYVIDEVAGQGGFGTVYRATQPVIGKRVAIKVLSRKYSADTEMVSRFASEARAVNQIKHRNIIDIFSFGQLPDGRQYYVMEYLDGEPLDRYLAAEGALTLEQALPILRAIARALDAAHAKGIAHRDLKPENVFLARDDEGAMFPKLLDFGIAKLTNTEEALAHQTRTGVPIGTPYYMSPEQCRGQHVDYRTDLYSFGVLCYRLLTGKYPFEGGIVDIMHKQMYEEPAPPSTHVTTLGSTVDVAIAWMMRKDPEQRPKTAIASVVALQDDKTPTPMMTPSTILKIEREIAPKRRWLAPAILGGVVAAGVVAVVALRGGDDGTKTSPIVAPPITSEPPPRPAVDAAIVVAVDAPVSATVAITVTGVPPNTEVKYAGELIGTAPGTVDVKRGSKEIQLVFAAKGYSSITRRITPDQDQSLTLTLPKAAAVRPNPVDDHDAIINDVNFRQRGKGK